MRRLSGTLVAITVAAAVLTATPASARSHVRFYAGPTSDGGSIRFRVVVADGVPRLTLLLFQGQYTCDDGTQGELAGDGYGWTSRGPVIEDNRLELSENEGGIAYDVSGRLGAHGGSGTLTLLMAGLTADEETAQLCALGADSWSVERTTGDDFYPAHDLEARNVDGTWFGTEAIEGSASDALAGAEGPLRRYRGRTSQDRGIAARTSRIETGVEMSFLSVGFDVTCDDGTVSEAVMRPLVYLGTTQVMDVGRFDLDVAPLTGFGLGFALHLHGELDAHAGSGTFSMISASLTGDRQPQLCTIGDQTWRLWRTDAGF